MSRTKLQYLKNLLKKEKNKQLNCINLIASENYASKNVLNASGSIFSNKYAEGYPDKRYYEGCKYNDLLEKYVIKSLKRIYKCEAANVQPHSGSQANAAAYLALLNPNDTVLALELNSGGHLTHGFKLNFSGNFYNFVHYKVNKNNLKLDYNQISKLAILHKPKLIVAGASSYSQIIDFKKISEICKQINAYFMVDMAHISGLVATGYHPSPIPYADVVTSTTHKTFRGPRGGFILCKEKYLAKINKAIFPGIQGGPLMNVIFAKGVACEEILNPIFKKYIKQVLINCSAMCRFFLKNNVDIVSGKSQNHQFSINTKLSFNLTGKNASELLAKFKIFVNKNVLPFDNEKPFYASGIRIGTPAITTLGYKKADCLKLARYILKILKNSKNLNAKILKNNINKLIKKFNNFY